MTFVISGLTPPPLPPPKMTKYFLFFFLVLDHIWVTFGKKNIFCPLKSVNTCKNFQNLQNSS